MHYRYQSKESYNQYDKLKPKQIKPRIISSWSSKKRIMPDSLKRIFVFLSLISRQIVGKQSKIFVCYYERVIRLYVCIISIIRNFGAAVRCVKCQLQSERLTANFFNIIYR